MLFLLLLFVSFGVIGNTNCIKVLDLNEGRFSNAVQTIVDNHNRYRQEAAHMPNLVWNSELAKLASKFAGRCKFDHSGDDERSNVDGFHYIGENLYVNSRRLVSNSDVSAAVKRAVESWAKERNEFSYPNDCSGQCGHYTQIVWAKTTDVGCGIAICDNEDFFSPGGYLVVCSYGPGGNFNNEQPYQLD